MTSLPRKQREYSPFHAQPYHVHGSTDNISLPQAPHGSSSAMSLPSAAGVQYVFTQLSVPSRSYQSPPNHPTPPVIPHPYPENNHTRDSNPEPHTEEDTLILTRLQEFRQSQRGEPGQRSQPRYSNAFYKDDTGYINGGLLHEEDVFSTSPARNSQYHGFQYTNNDSHSGPKELDEDIKTEKNMPIMAVVGADLATAGEVADVHHFSSNAETEGKTRASGQVEADGMMETKLDTPTNTGMERENVLAPPSVNHRGGAPDGEISPQIIDREGASQLQDVGALNQQRETESHRAYQQVNDDDAVSDRRGGQGQQRHKIHRTKTAPAMTSSPPPTQRAMQIGSLDTDTNPSHLEGPPNIGVEVTPPTIPPTSSTFASSSSSTADPIQLVPISPESLLSPITPDTPSNGDLSLFFRPTESSSSLVVDVADADVSDMSPLISGRATDDVVEVRHHHQQLPNHPTDTNANKGMGTLAETSEIGQFPPAQLLGGRVSSGDVDEEGIESTNTVTPGHETDDVVSRNDSVDTSDSSDEPFEQLTAEIEFKLLQLDQAQSQAHEDMQETGLNQADQTRSGPVPVESKSPTDENIQADVTTETHVNGDVPEVPHVTDQLTETEAVAVTVTPSIEVQLEASSPVTIGDDPTDVEPMIDTLIQERILPVTEETWNSDGGIAADQQNEQVPNPTEVRSDAVSRSVIDDLETLLQVAAGLRGATSGSNSPTSTDDDNSEINNDTNDDNGRSSSIGGGGGDCEGIQGGNEDISQVGMIGRGSVNTIKMSKHITRNKSINMPSDSDRLDYKNRHDSQVGDDDDDATSHALASIGLRVDANRKHILPVTSASHSQPSTDPFTASFRALSPILAPSQPPKTYDEHRIGNAGPASVMHQENDAPYNQDRVDSAYPYHRTLPGNNAQQWGNSNSIGLPRHHQAPDQRRGRYKGEMEQEEVALALSILSRHFIADEVSRVRDTYANSAAGLTKATHLIYDDDDDGAHRVRDIYSQNATAPFPTSRLPLSSHHYTNTPIRDEQPMLPTSSLSLSRSGIVSTTPQRATSIISSSSTSSTSMSSASSRLPSRAQRLPYTRPTPSSELLHSPYPSAPSSDPQSTFPHSTTYHEQAIKPHHDPHFLAHPHMPSMDPVDALSRHIGDIDEENRATDHGYPLSSSSSSISLASPVPASHRHHRHQHHQLEQEQRELQHRRNITYHYKYKHHALALPSSSDIRYEVITPIHPALTPAVPLPSHSHPILNGHPPTDAALHSPPTVDPRLMVDREAALASITASHYRLQTTNTLQDIITALTPAHPRVPSSSVSLLHSSPLNHHHREASTSSRAPSPKSPPTPPTTSVARDSASHPQPTAISSTHETPLPHPPNQVTGTEHASTASSLPTATTTTATATTTTTSTSSPLKSSSSFTSSPSRSFTSSSSSSSFSLRTNSLTLTVRKILSAPTFSKSTSSGSAPALHSIHTDPTNASSTIVHATFGRVETYTQEVHAHQQSSLATATTSSSSSSSSSPLIAAPHQHPLPHGTAPFVTTTPPKTTTALPLQDQSTLSPLPPITLHFDSPSTRPPAISLSPSLPPSTTTPNMTPSLLDSTLVLDTQTMNDLQQRLEDTQRLLYLTQQRITSRVAEMEVQARKAVEEVAEKQTGLVSRVEDAMTRLESRFVEAVKIVNERPSVTEDAVRSSSGLSEKAGNPEGVKATLKLEEERSVILSVKEGRKDVDREEGHGVATSKQSNSETSTSNTNDSQIDSKPIGADPQLTSQSPSSSVSPSHPSEVLSSSSSASPPSPPSPSLSTSSSSSTSPASSMSTDLPASTPSTEGSTSTMATSNNKPTPENHQETTSPQSGRKLQLRPSSKQQEYLIQQVHEEALRQLSEQHRQAEEDLLEAHRQLREELEGEVDQQELKVDALKEKLRKLSLRSKQQLKKEDRQQVLTLLEKVIRQLDQEEKRLGELMMKEKRMRQQHDLERNEQQRHHREEERRQAQRLAAQQLHGLELARIEAGLSPMSKATVKEESMSGRGKKPTSQEAAVPVDRERDKGKGRGEIKEQLNATHPSLDNELQSPRKGNKPNLVQKMSSQHLSPSGGAFHGHSAEHNEPLAKSGHDTPTDPSPREKLTSSKSNVIKPTSSPMKTSQKQEDTMASRPDKIKVSQASHNEDDANGKSSEKTSDFESPSSSEPVGLTPKTAIKKRGTIPLKTQHKADVDKANTSRNPDQENTNITSSSTLSPKEKPKVLHKSQINSKNHSIDSSTPTSSDLDSNQDNPSNPPKQPNTASMTTTIHHSSKPSVVTPTESKSIEKSEQRKKPVTDGTSLSNPSRSLMKTPHLTRQEDELLHPSKRNEPKVDPATAADTLLRSLALRNSSLHKAMATTHPDPLLHLNHPSNHHMTSFPPHTSTPMSSVDDSTPVWRPIVALLMLVICFALIFEMVPLSPNFNHRPPRSFK